MTLAAITTLPKTTHNTSTLNMGETSSNYSLELSLSSHKSSHGTLLNSHSRFIEDPGCKPAVEKETWSPCLCLWPGQIAMFLQIQSDNNY